MYTVVKELSFPFIKSQDKSKNSAYRKYIGNAIFKLSTPLMPPRVVNSMDYMYVLMAKNPDDSKCDLYEYLLNKLFQSGINIRFSTPCQVIQMTVQFMEPKQG